MFIVARKVANLALILPAIVLAICINVFTHVDAFIFSTSSTAMTGLVLPPSLNLIVALCFGFLIGWLLIGFGQLKKRRLDANQYIPPCQ